MTKRGKKEKNSFWRRLSPHAWTAIFLGFALILNTIVHFTSPAYSKYEELGRVLSDQIRDKFVLLDLAHSNFCARVESEFVPEINKMISVIASSDSSSSGLDGVSAAPSSVVDDSPPFLDIRASYSYVYCKVGSNRESGAYINGWFFRDGDTYMGKRIIRLCPECALLEGGIIRPREDDNTLDTRSFEVVSK